MEHTIKNKVSIDWKQYEIITQYMFNFIDIIQINTHTVSKSSYFFIPENAFIARIKKYMCLGPI